MAMELTPMAGAPLAANRIDYDDGKMDRRAAPLHDLLNEPHQPGVSRLIFVNHMDHYASCDICQQHLRRQWAWPAYMFRAACHMSNGYIQETVLHGDTEDETVCESGESLNRDCRPVEFGFVANTNEVKHFRCLVKQIMLDLNEKKKTEIQYEWYEMGFTLRQHKNGATSLICFGVPQNFHTTFREALIQVATDRQWRTDGERVGAALMQEVARLYDESVWAISRSVRRVEKDRFKLEFDFEMMHELLRHALHTTEVIAVAVDSLKELSRVRLANGPATPVPAGSVASVATGSDMSHQHYDFWCRLLQNFQRRSKANEERLKNEIHLAYNLVAQKDSRATIELSHAAQKDSAAMRTIAFVTLVFLPATFVSTFFGMSFFNYQKADGWSMTGETWIFWVVSIPLTLVIIAAYALGQYYVHRQNKMKSKKRAMTFRIDLGTTI